MRIAPSIAQIDKVGIGEPVYAVHSLVAAGTRKTHAVETLFNVQYDQGCSTDIHDLVDADVGFAERCALWELFSSDFEKLQQTGTR